MGEKEKGLTKSPFLAINAKGGESISPKQKDCITTNFKIFNWYILDMLIFQELFQNWYLNVFDLIWYLQKLVKPPWTPRGEFIQGEFCLSQRKSIWNRGRKFQILKMLLEILFIYLWLFAKRLWKDFPKEFAKTKQVVQAWSKMLNKKKVSMHIQ
jgi:hypothetical protein